MNIVALRNNSVKFSFVIFNTFRQASTKSSDNVSWSSGKKQKPLSWRHDPEMWYRRSKHLISPQNPLDPKDPMQKYPYKRDDGGIQYHNFVYYPRHEDEVDPEIEPTPLFLVYRTKRLRHTSGWEKNICKKLGIDGYKSGKITVVKNIPEMNAMLWQIKHLVKVQPLKFPKDIKDDNPLHYFIKENGEVLYCPSVRITENDLEQTETETNMNIDWVNEQTRKKYNNSLKVEF